MQAMDVSEMARLGGLARKKSMTPEERRKAAQKAIKARWCKTTKAERSAWARKAAQARWDRAKTKQSTPKS